METLPKQVTMVSLFLLVCFISIFVSDAAETSTSCPEVACFGQPVNITCDITGTYESIGFSRPDTLEVVTCFKDRPKCYVNSPGYDAVLRLDDKHIMSIKNLSKNDVGKWNCRDSTNPLLKTCSIKGYDERESPTSAPPSRLSDNCINIEKKIRPQTLCKGFQEDQNVNITIRMADNSYSFTYDQYKQNDEVELAVVPKGGDLECSVTGPAAQCYTASGPTKTKICSKPFPPWAIAFIVLVIGVIIGVLVDCFYCRPRDKGATHYVKAKLMSKNADVATACPEKEKQKTEGATTETDSPVETNPLLDVNSHMIVENETEKTKELEPEDKPGAATEPKSDDKGVDGTGGKSPDKGVDGTGGKSPDKGVDGTGGKSPDKGVDGTGGKSPDKGVDGTGGKSPDKGPAVLVVKSENKQAP